MCEIYRNYKIMPECPPIPLNINYVFHHVEYDGPCDNRCGFAETIEDAKFQIDEMIEWEDEAKYEKT